MNKQANREDMSRENVVSSEVATAPGQEKRKRKTYIGTRRAQLTLCCRRRSKTPMGHKGGENRWMASPKRGFRKTRRWKRKWKRC